MGDAGFVVIGAKEIEAALREIGTVRVDAAERRILTQGAALIEKAAKANFEGSHKRGEPHVGGDKPNVVTGTLRRSIYHTPIAGTPGNRSVQVGPRVVYARAIEWGNPRNNSRPLPYFEPAVQQVTPAIGEMAAREWAAALSGGGA